MGSSCFKFFRVVVIMLVLLVVGVGVDVVVGVDVKKPPLRPITRVDIGKCYYHNRYQRMGEVEG